MPRDEELPIIRAFYDFVLWLNPKIAKFPRDQRFVLGERMERQLYEVLENLIRAKYTRSRRGILDQVNLDLEILRFQIGKGDTHNRSRVKAPDLAIGIGKGDITDSLHVIISVMSPFPIQ